MAVAGEVDALPGVRDNFYTNLLLLSFNPTQSEMKYKIVFDKHMFDLPNKKGMEVVMQFLLWKLDEDLWRAQFRDCWPVFDKKQEQQFRKNCSEWIARISKEAPNSDLPRSSAMTMGVLMSPGGEKFYQFIRSFSTHILEDSLKKNAPDDFLVPNFSMEYETHPVFREVHVEAMKKMIVIYSNDVTKKLQEIDDCHKQWRDYVGKLTERHRDANKLNRTLKKKLSDLQALQKKAASERLPRSNPNISTSQCDVEVKIEEELSDEKRTARMKKVKQLWKSVQDFVTQSDHQKRVIDSILSGNVDQYVIDAKELFFKIPEMLIKDFEELFQQGLVDNTYEEGKPSILSLLTLWNISMEKLYNTLKKMPIEVPKSSVEYRHRELESIRAKLAKQLQKRSKLQTQIEEVNTQIYKLRAQLDSLTTKVTSEQCTVQEQPFVPMPRYTVPPLNTSFLKPMSLKQPQAFDTTSAPGNTPKLISVAPTDELSTVQRVKKLSDSVLKHATTNQKQTEIPSLLTTTTRTAWKMLPVVANKTNTDTIRRRIEYYSDEDNDDDQVDDHLDSTLIMNDDHDNLDDALTINTPEPRILSSPVTPSSHDKAKSHSPISSSPKDPQDVLADKIASYVVASSDDDYSPDPKLLYYEATSTDEKSSSVSVSGTMREETEEEENQTVLSMTELQYYSSSEEEGLSDKDLEWPVGVTPDIKTVKARISRQHQLSRDTTAQPLKASITSVPDSEASWLHVGSDDKELHLDLVPSTPSKTQDK